METFTDTKDFVENLHFDDQKRKCLVGLSADMIDKPILGLINTLNNLPFCFTLQCCYGHFVYDDQPDPHSLAPLSLTNPHISVEYRIAYLALCIDNSESGLKLFNIVQHMSAIDPANIQFGCAEWFWRQQLNSYVVQVEPDRFKYQDTARFDGQEALKIEKTRNRFFAQLSEVLQNSSCLIA
ncbi:hypothetical protein JXQ70_12825 [bacterium]|nr:hypothetical protein [bacterium]